MQFRDKCGKQAFQTKKWIEENQENINKTLITIPVVVHVVWKTQQQNISEAQIQSQIDILNQDFRRLNLDAANDFQNMSTALGSYDCSLPSINHTVYP